MTKWEYFVVDNLTEAAANKLGGEGWELVSVRHNGGPRLQSDFTQGWFKRAYDWNE
jgi:hypothetical protein|tara:strand:- start:64 stop:231 length:168 start_codon:yes stop_codon:yes gene_type:complete